MPGPRRDFSGRPPMGRQFRETEGHPWSGDRAACGRAGRGRGGAGHLGAARPGRTGEAGYPCRSRAPSFAGRRVHVAWVHSNGPLDATLFERRFSRGRAAARRLDDRRRRSTSGTPPCIDQAGGLRDDLRWPADGESRHPPRPADRHPGGSRGGPPDPGLLDTATYGVVSAVRGRRAVPGVRVALACGRGDPA